MRIVGINPEKRRNNMENFGLIMCFLIVVFFIVATYAMISDHKKRQVAKVRQADMNYLLSKGNILMYYDPIPGVPFDPFKNDKRFIHILERRDGFVKYEVQVYKQSYDKADKLDGSHFDSRPDDELYTILRMRNAKIINDVNKKQ